MGREDLCLLDFSVIQGLRALGIEKEHFCYEIHRFLSLWNPFTASLISLSCLLEVPVFFLPHPHCWHGTRVWGMLGKHSTVEPHPTV